MYGDFRKTVYIAQYVAENAEIFYTFLILEVIPQVMPRQNTKHYKSSTNKQMPFSLKTASAKGPSINNFFFNPESRVDNAFGTFRWKITRISSRTLVFSSSKIIGRVRKKHEPLAYQGP
jgi:hypothetical protein